MTQYVAFLRGINVGGQKKFPKAEQVALLESLKVMNPQVYLHTGNWIFASEKDALHLEKQMVEAIEREYGWEVPVVVKSASALAEIYQQCPFSEEKMKKSYFVLLYETPSEANKNAMLGYDFPGETAHVTDACVYFHSDHGYGNAKMNNNWFESKLKVAATTRNYNTMVKVMGMA